MSNRSGRYPVSATERVASVLKERFYFSLPSLVGQRCLALTHPVVGCARKDRRTQECVRPVYDTSKPKQYTIATY